MHNEQGFMRALKCRECGREYPLMATHVCEFDFGPLEVVYDYERIKQTLTAAAIQSRPKSMWRYRELLPVANDPTVGLQVGFTPLMKADRLTRRLGIRELWIKNDTANYPSLPFQHRGESVAFARAKALGFETAACASTGKSSSTRSCAWRQVHCSPKSRRAIRSSPNSGWWRKPISRSTARRLQAARRFRPRRKPGWISSSRSNPTPLPSPSPSARPRT